MAYSLMCYEHGAPRMQGECGQCRANAKIVDQDTASAWRDLIRSVEYYQGPKLPGLYPPVRRNR